MNPPNEDDFGIINPPMLCVVQSEACIKSPLYGSLSRGIHHLKINHVKSSTRMAEITLATPIMGGLYSYHIFPMIVIFILVGFGPFFDSVSFNILERHERRKAASLGVATR